MPAKSAKPSTAPKKTQAPVASSVKKPVVKKPASPKKPAVKKPSLSKKPKSPNSLDHLFIPGLTSNVVGYDGAIPAWLVEFGLTVMIFKNWLARPNDRIVIVNMATMDALDSKVLKPGEEQDSTYSFTIRKELLPEGDMRIGYLVFYEGGEEFDASFPLFVLIKYSLPGGYDRDLIQPGHSELNFSVPYTEIYPAQANRGVLITIEVYPNIDIWDMLHVMWAGVTISQKVTSLDRPTTVLIPKDTLYDAGDGPHVPIGFFVTDRAGNASDPRSADILVRVDLDSGRTNPPAILNDSPPGYIELERLNNGPQEIQLYTTASVGAQNEIYDLTARVYPVNGGVVVCRAFLPIVIAGTPVHYELPYNFIQAGGGGGRIEIGYVLRRLNDREDVPSRKTFAIIVGALARLSSPYFESFLNHVVNPIPDHTVVVIPWYAWRKPTDKITLILRYQKSFSETIICSKTYEVGPSWPIESPFKVVVYRDFLEKFDGYTAELYYIYENAENRARSFDLNESLRQDVKIGTSKQPMKRPTKQPTK